MQDSPWRKRRNIGWESRKRVGVCRVRQVTEREEKKENVKGKRIQKEKEIMKEEINNVEKKKEEDKYFLVCSKIIVSTFV